MTEVEYIVSDYAAKGVGRTDTALLMDRMWFDE